MICSCLIVLVTIKTPATTHPKKRKALKLLPQIPFGRSAQTFPGAWIKDVPVVSWVATQLQYCGIGIVNTVSQLHPASV